MNFWKTLKVKVLHYFNFTISIYLLCIIPAFSQEKRYRFTEQKMGSTFEITFYHADSIKAQLLAKNAYKIIDSLNNSFSDYFDLSEIGIIAKNAGNGLSINISKDLLNIFIESKKAYERSFYTFDITLGPLTKLWRQTKKEKKLPNKNQLHNTILNTGVQYLWVDSVKNQARLTKKNMSIDLGGIGKGYAAQKVFEYFLRNDISQVLIDAAGNMAIGNPPPGENNWKIGVEIPSNSNFLNNKILKLNKIAISTSGDAYQFVEINGKKYSHILNPKTGLGLQNQRQVTVLCENATKADWLSTAICILPIKKGLILAKNEKAEVLIIENKANKLVEYKSKGFDKYFN